MQGDISVMKKIIIIGGRGNGTVIASTIEDINMIKKEYEILGFLNDGFNISEKISGYPVLGPVTRETCEKYEDALFIYALISVGKAEERVKKLNDLNLSIEKFPTIIHPTAVVSLSATLKSGVIIMPNVVVGPDVEIGDFTQIYANSLIGHDTKIKDYCFIANSASIGSMVTLEQGAHIGSNASVIEKVTIGQWSLTGLGSVVLKDIEPYSKVVGNPANSIGYLN